MGEDCAVAQSENTEWPDLVGNIPVVWTDLRWLWPTGIGVLVLLSCIVWAYRRRGPRRFLMIGLKLAAVMLIGLSLTNPLWSRTKPQSGENIVLLAADNSASLSIQGPGAQPRGTEFRTALQASEAPWQIRLGQDFDLRRFQINERIQLTEDFHALDHTASDSPLLDSVLALQNRFDTLPLAAVLLFTDGQATDPELFSQIRPEVPIFPVLPMDGGDLGDLWIEQVTVSQSPFEDAPLTIQATIRSRDLTAGHILATLIRHHPGAVKATPAAEETTAESEGVSATSPATPHDTSIAETQQLEVLLGEGGTGQVKFELIPDEVGTLFYELQVEANSGTEASSLETVPELTLKNNSRLLVVEHRAEPRRILYVGGRPNWEHKFLNRAVADDPQVTLVSLLRIARKEGKFDFRGRVGESSNPLFRGFKENPDEETEAYYEPVLVRVNTVDEAELRDGFPKTKEALYRYDALILDDVEGEFFTREQQQLIDRFVAERGGALLMLGGIDTFHQGGWNKTSVRDALPMYLDRPVEHPQGSVRLRLTREGWLEPWIRLRATEQEEQLRLSELADYQIQSPLQHLKPAARVMSEVLDESGTAFPALVVQQYGEGRAGAMLLGDLWRPELKRADPDNSDLGQAWRQMLRWLVAETPQRIVISTAPVSGKSNALTVQVRLRDAEYQSLENAAVAIEVTTPTNEVLSLQGEPALEEAGLFTATVLQRDSGAYRVSATATVEEGTELLTGTTGWTYDAAAAEFALTEINRDLMQQLADRTGGEVLTVADLPDFVESLQSRELPAMVLETTPLWHSPWLLLAALSCLLLEWCLRRRGGLA